MTTYISILRGINVSGQRMIKMNALKEVYERLLFLNVQTYIQSGNVVFQCDACNTEDLACKISSAILTAFGFDVPVIVLEVAELKAIIDSNPFKADPEKIESDLYISFLSSIPEDFDLNKICQKKSQEEEITLVGKAVYLYCPIGYGRTKLTNSFIESMLKVKATTRNWKTTTELFKIADIQNNTKR